MLATIKLIANYFLKGFAGPFFMFFFPFLLLLIVGESYIMPTYNAIPEGNTTEVGEALNGAGNGLRSLIGGITASTIITISFLQMPGTVIEFKNSVILKRIGATRIKMWQFFLALVLVYLVIAIVAFFYLMLLSGLLFATRMTRLDDPWNYVLPSTNYIGEVIGYFFLFFTVMCLFGLALGSVVKRQTTSQILSTFLFFPTSFLVGGFVPPQLIAQSDVLKVLQYIFPHTQPVVGFTTFWGGTSEALVSGSEAYNELLGTSIGIGFGLILLFGFIIFRFFKWNS